MLHALWRACVPPDRISTAVVNTGDDTTMHGLSISPDLDTITYTLAGAIDPSRGWGLRDETWRAMEALGRFRCACAPRTRPRARRGSASATRTWRLTSTAPHGSARARPHDGHRRDPARLRCRGARCCRCRIERVATEVQLADGDWIELPGLLRPPAPRRRQPSGALHVRTARRCQRRRGTAIDGGRRGGDRPEQPAGVDRHRSARCQVSTSCSPTGATRSSPSHRSSPAPRSRAPPTGCSRSSGTRRRSSASPACTPRSPARW